MILVLTAIVQYRMLESKRRLTKQLEELTEEMQTLLKQTSTVCWKYYVKEQSVELLQNDVLPERYMQKGRLENVPQYFIEQQLIHPDSQKEFLKMYGLIQAGIKKSEGIFCTRNSVDSPWCWNKITYINHLDAQGNPLEAIGFANDVTLEKEKELAMQTQAEIDPMTCVYNRYAFAQKANELFCDRRKKKSRMVLGVWDIDAFYTVNKRFGYQKGDAILREFADILREGCRQTDLIGRMDGDEFLILFLDVHETVPFENRVQRMLSRISLITLSDDTKLTASVGLTLTGDTVEEFTQVYRRAKEARKEAQALGGNQYVIK